jgi:hypothetical protein
LPNAQEFLVAISLPAVASALTGEGFARAADSAAAPGIPDVRFRAAGEEAFHRLVRRMYQLARALPTAPLDTFRAKTSGLPDKTDVERLVIQRVGQNIFRDALLEYWSGRCAITGIDQPELLRASHIVPWSECDSDEHRLDVYNGFLLSALWDAAFDRGLVSFSDEGQPLASPSLGAAARAALAFDSAPPMPGLRDAHRSNLRRHRASNGF